MIKSIIHLIILITVPFAIIVLPPDFFDGGESICLSQVLFDRECYACGLTRGCMHLIHFDVEQAFYYNMGSFIALPAISTMWIAWFISERKRLITFIQTVKLQSLQDHPCRITPQTINLQETQNNNQ